jgi:hypothetical protein
MYLGFSYVDTSAAIKLSLTSATYSTFAMRPDSIAKLDSSGSGCSTIRIQSRGSVGGAILDLVGHFKSENQKVGRLASKNLMNRVAYSNAHLRIMHCIQQLIPFQSTKVYPASLVDNPVAFEGAYWGIVSLRVSILLLRIK